MTELNDPHAKILWDSLPPSAREWLRSIHQKAYEKGYNDGYDIGTKDGLADGIRGQAAAANRYD